MKFKFNKIIFFLIYIYIFFNSTRHKDIWRRDYHFITFLLKTYVSILISYRIYLVR